MSNDLWMSLALRGAATLKARALKEVWNVAAVIPVEKGGLGSNHNHGRYRDDSQLRRKNSEGSDGRGGDGGGFSGELAPEENFLGLCSQELLARGTELLKRTRQGEASNMFEFRLSLFLLHANVVLIVLCCL